MAIQSISYGDKTDLNNSATYRNLNETEAEQC